MRKDVLWYCSVCSNCKYSKIQSAQSAPLRPVIASKPWELVAVNILKVLMYSSRNQYILVTQDYFSKCPFAWAIPDQKAERIVQILRDEFFSLWWGLQASYKVEFQIADLCKAFHVTKSHTISSYWRWLSGVHELITTEPSAYLHRTASRLATPLVSTVHLSHHSTGLSPFEVVFGSNPTSPPLIQQLFRIQMIMLLIFNGK